jgi:transposase
VRAAACERKSRNLVERFNRIKQSRRIATRYDKLTAE